LLTTRVGRVERVREGAKIHDSRFTIHDSRFTIHDSPVVIKRGDLAPLREKTYRIE